MELKCLRCERELPEDNYGNHNGLVLWDERGQIARAIASWCDEGCMGEWLVKAALDVMLKRMMSPSQN